MKLYAAITFVGLLAVGLLAFAPGAAALQDRVPDTLDDRAELLAYGMGYYLGDDVRRGLKTDGLDVDEHDIVRGFIDGLHGSRSVVSQEALDEVLYSVHEEMQRRAVQQLIDDDPHFKKLHDDNLAASKAYLAKQASRPDIKSLPGGIYYEVLAEGDGPSPGRNDSVRVNYEVMLLDGRPLASGMDQSMAVNDMTRGTGVVLQAMKVGDRWQVFIPPDLAYGVGGDPPVVGPNEVLVGQIELLGIESTGTKR